MLMNRRSQSGSPMDAVEQQPQPGQQDTKNLTAIVSNNNNGGANQQDGGQGSASAAVEVKPLLEGEKEKAHHHHHHHHEQHDALQHLRIPFYLMLNACSSVGIVFANKVVFQIYHFKYGTLLTFFHFIFTFLGLEVCRQLGVFERKQVSIRAILPLCASFCGFVALTNLSLVYNSVGFYQLMKVLTTPLLVIIQTIWYHETFSAKIKSSLALTCVGVAIATVTDSEANLKGTLIALSALLITCMYQIWVGTKQKELECNSYQLLYWQAPISALILIPLIPILDDLSTLKEMPNNATLTAIFISCCLAFLVNLSIFLVIGKTSPVTYNVLGHFKLTVILSMGFLFFGAPVDYKNISGVLVTLSGVIWYTHLKQNKQ